MASVEFFTKLAKYCKSFGAKIQKNEPKPKLKNQPDKNTIHAQEVSGSEDRSEIERIRESTQEQDQLAAFTF